jgi:hypothetical protein
MIDENENIDDEKEIQNSIDECIDNIPEREIENDMLRS